jgi:hypothetical protein
MESTVAAPGKREIYLDRRIFSAWPERIDVHPARSIVVLPLVTLAIGLAAFPVIYFWGDAFPLAVRFALTLAALMLVPLSGLGLVYSVAGAHVVIDRHKQSLVLQQGYLGMGVGTQELVPFWKIDRVLLRDLTPHDERGHDKDFAQYEVAVLKLSGREVPIGTVTVARAEAAAGHKRAREVAELVAGMSGAVLEDRAAPTAVPAAKVAQP